MRHYLVTSYAPDFMSFRGMITTDLKKALDTAEHVPILPKDHKWLISWLDSDLPIEDMTIDTAHDLCDTGSVPWGNVKPDGTHDEPHQGRQKVTAADIEKMRATGLKIDIISQEEYERRTRRHKGT